MSWENSGGGLTTQPVSTATMTTVTSANRGDLESFSSRCWTFRRTHTSADPIRVLCTRLALPLTLSLTSRLAPCARLTVDVPTRALWLAGIFLRRKKRCAGVVGTRTDWVLKGEEGGMATPLLQYVARFDGGGEIFGFGGGGYKESWPWCSLFVGFPSLFVAPSGEKPALRFRPRGVVAGRGVVAVCTRISSQEHVYESWPWCSLFVGFPSLFVAPSGEKPALRFRPRAVVAGRGVVAVCTRISSQEHVYDK